MADETIKKLLVKLGISTQDWKVAVNDIKNQLTAINTQAKADAQSMKSLQKEQIDLTKQQIADQKRLQEESKTMLSLDQAKAAWEKKNQEVLKTKIQQRILETAELKKQQLAQEGQVKLETGLLALANKKLAVKTQEETVDAKIAREALAASEKLKQEQLEAEERVRRLAAQQKISGIVAQAGQVATPQYTAAQLVQQRELLTQEKQRLALMEAELRLQGTQEGVKKEDLALAQKQIAEERAKLAVQEAQIVKAQTQLSLEKQRELVLSQTVDKEQVLRITQKLGYSPFTPPKMPSVVAGDTVTNTAVFSSQIASEKEKLSLMEAELRVMAQQETYRKVDIQEVQKTLIQERQKLVLQETELRRVQQIIKVQEQTVNRSAVSAIQQRINFTPAPVPKVGGLLGVGGILGQSTASALESVGKEKEKLAIMQAELRVMVQQGEYRKVDVNEVTKVLSQERQRLDLLAMQLREQREQSLMGKITGGVEGAVGGVGRTLQKLTGGGLLGSIVVGGIGIEAFNQVIEKIGELKADLIGAVGPAQQLRVEFERLATAKGADPTEMLEKLRQGTRGLVADLDLYKTANNFLRSGIKITNDQMQGLVSTTIELARATGHTAPQAMQALQQYFTTGYPRALSRVTGIQRQMLVVKGLSSTLDPIQKRTIEAVNLLHQEEIMFGRVGKAATTVPEILTQVTVAQQNFVEGVAKGLTGSNSFNEALSKISQKLTDLGPKLEDTAVKIGKKLGDAIEWVRSHFGEIKTGIEILIGLKVTQWAFQAAGAFAGWGSEAVKLARSIGLIKTAEESLAAVRGVATVASTAEAVGGGVGWQAARTAAGIGAAEAAPVALEAGAAIVGGGIGVTILALGAGVAAAFGIKQLVEWLNKHPEKTSGIGDAVGSTIRGADYSETLINAFDKYISAENKFAEYVDKFGLAVGDFFTKTPKQALNVVTDTVGGLLYGKQEAPTFGQTAPSLKLGTAGPLPGYQEVARTLALQHTPGYIAPKTPEQLAQDQANLTLEKKLGAQELQLRKILDKTLLDETKQRIADEEEALKDQYDEGIISLQDYVTKEKALKTEQHQSTIKQLKDDLAAQLHNVDIGKTITIGSEEYATEDPRVAANARSLLIQQEYDKEVQENTRHNKEMHGLDKQLLSDQLAARQEFTQAINKVSMDGVNERKTILESEFKQGNVGAQAYIDERKALIQEELNLTLDGLDRKREAARNNEKELASINAAEIEARMKAEKEATDFDLSQDDIRLQSLQTHYDKAKKYLTTQAAITAEVPSNTQAQDQFAINSALLSITDQYIAKQSIALRNENLSVDARAKITEDIAQATQEQAKLNIEIARSKDLSIPLAGIFSQVAGLLGEFRNTQGAVAVLNNTSKSLESISKFTTFVDASRMAQSATGPKVDIAKTAQQLFDEQVGKSASTVSALGRESDQTAKYVAVLGSQIDQLNAKLPLMTKGVPLQSAENKNEPQTILPDLPYYPKGFEVGGPVPQTMLTTVHKGEHVLTAEEVVQEKQIQKKSIDKVNELVSNHKTFNDISYEERKQLVDSYYALKSFPRKFVAQDYTQNIHTYETFFATASTRPPVTTATPPKVAPKKSTLDTFFDKFKVLPSFEAGGTVPGVGPTPVMAHGGEEILSITQVSVISQMMKVFKELTGVLSTSVNKLTTFDKSLEKIINKAAGSVMPKIGPPEPMSEEVLDQTMAAVGHSAEQPKVKSPFDQLTAPVQSLSKSFMGLFHSTDKATGAQVPFAARLQDFTGKLGGWISGLQGLIQGITGGKNAAGGALSGGMAGLQFGANFGPIGAAVGAVGGAALGAVFGNKEAHLTADLKKVQDQMQSIIESMNLGTISLSSAIADLRKERQSALSMLSGDKKGSKSKKGQPSQVQQAIQAIDAEISKLVDEQTQILHNLTSSLITLSQPLQFQEYLTSLDQIIQKYQEFASAAQGNAQEMTNANDFLNLSLQNYVTTLNQQLNAAQQTAINDALTLINLEYQRQQLINQTAQQEYDILTQGVAVRQRTTAMTKGQEIGVLRYQRDMQLEQMNEQIALNQAKVDAETKIFGLATTRIGLENQLLAAQKEQADYQIAQVLALSQVVSDLTSGLSSGQIMQQLQALESGGQLPTGSGLLMLLAQILGLGGNVPGSVTGGQYGTQNWLNQVPQQYQAAANYVAQQNPNFYSDFEAAAGTPSGSSARLAAEADVQPLLAQGKVEGLDMQGFVNWLATGSIPTLQSLETGGPVRDTGPILAHEGEHVLNAPTVSKLNMFGGVDKVISGITKAFSSIGKAVSGRPLAMPHAPIARPLGIGVQDASGLQLQVHSAMLGLTQQRSGIEMNIISARQAHLGMEMSYLSALNATLDKVQNTSLNIMAGSTDIEALLQKKYEIRGRYGSANFRRETL